MAGFRLQEHFKSKLLFPAWAALGGTLGLEFLQLNPVFYKPLYNCSFLPSREPWLFHCTAAFTVHIPGCKLPLGSLKWDP